MSENAIKLVDDEGHERKFTRAACWKGGEVWLGNGQIIVIGTPNPEEDDDSPEAHNCDAMGCGTDHVVYRNVIPTDEEVRAALADYEVRLDAAIADAKASARCFWCELVTVKMDSAELQQHYRTCEKSPLVAELAKFRSAIASAASFIKSALSNGDGDWAHRYLSKLLETWGEFG